MNEFHERLNNIESYLKNNELDLGYRRLIDSILDLGDLQFYDKIIDYSDFYYNEHSRNDHKKERALNILKELKNIPAPNYQESETLISVDQLEKTYSKSRFKLHPITFNLKSREIIGLVGENGNGKTTLLRLICGELKQSSGAINYLFSKADQFSYALKTELVYIPQRIDVLYGTLMNNLQFTLSCYGINNPENILLANVILARLGLWPYRNFQWTKLSSGYKMRFELARNLLRKPKILLLDEPLANLDILAQQVILEDIKYLSQSVRNPFGVILSSQQLYEVEKISTKVLFLENGILNIQNDEENNSDKLTIIEIDINNSKEDLISALSKLNLINLKFNGGVYIAYFNKSITINNVLLEIGKYNNLQIKYVRDISNSSRRFFIN